MEILSRTPHGVRGLKSAAALPCSVDVESHPTRGAWIEILGGDLWQTVSRVAPHTGCVD